MSLARRAAASAIVVLAASLGLGGCGDRERRSTAVPPPTGSPVESDVERAVRQAAQATWLAIDRYDAKAFAAISVDRKRTPPASPEAKDVEDLVMELHQKYGARPYRLFPEPLASVNAETGVVDVLIGEREDAVALTFTRVAGAWKLSSISNADPQAIGPAAK